MILKDAHLCVIPSPMNTLGLPFCSVTLHGNREFADVIKVINHLTLKWRTLVWARCNYMIPLKAKMFLWLMAEEVREIPNIRITEHAMAHVKMNGHVMREECSRTWQPAMNQFLQKPEWTWDPILPPSASWYPGKPTGTSDLQNGKLTKRCCLKVTKFVVICFAATEN